MKYLIVAIYLLVAQPVVAQDIERSLRDVANSLEGFRTDAMLSDMQREYQAANAVQYYQAALQMQQQANLLNQQAQLLNQQKQQMQREIQKLQRQLATAERDVRRYEQVQEVYKKWVEQVHVAFEAAAFKSDPAMLQHIIAKALKQTSPQHDVTELKVEVQATYKKRASQQAARP